MKRALVLWAIASIASAAGEKPKLIVLDLAAAGVDPQVAAALTQAITLEIAARGLFDAVASSELQTLIHQSRQQQLLGCAQESGSCLAELAGAAGARFVMSGSLARLGAVYQLTLQTLDSAKAAPIGRSTRITPDLAALRAQLPYAIAEATGTPMPPPPSRTLPYGLMIGGGIGFLGGSLSLFAALTEQTAIQRELQTAQTNPAVLRPRADYVSDQQTITVLSWVGIGGMVAGAAVAAVGFWINPSDGARPASAMSIVPTPGGAALVASW